MRLSMYSFLDVVLECIICGTVYLIFSDLIRLTMRLLDVMIVVLMGHI